MIRSMGLDLSLTAPGLTILEKKSGGEINFIRAEQIPVPPATKMDYWQRVMEIAFHISGVVAAYPPHEVVIENYGQKSHGGVSSFIKQVGVGSLVRLDLYNSGIKWREVPPQSLKKFVTGNGSADKKGMIHGVQEQWGFVTKNHNVADSVGLAAIGLVIRGVMAARPHQLDVIEAIRTMDGY